MEWVKKILKCKIRGIHKLTLNGTHCVLCGKRIIREHSMVQSRNF